LRSSLKVSDQVSFPFKFLDKRWEDKRSELHGSKHSPV
jgi:hypothetical protein